VHDGPGYTGHVMDASTGLTYMQQRYYDPDGMHFLSMDPVDASSSNGSNLDRYWYANDNPYRYTDPDGRYGESDDVRDKRQHETVDPQRRRFGAESGSLEAHDPGVSAFLQGATAQGSSGEMGTTARVVDAIGSTLLGTAFNKMKRPDHPTKVPDKFAHQLFMTNAAGVGLAASPGAVALGGSAVPVAADAAGAAYAVAGNAAAPYVGRAALAGCLAASFACHGASEELQELPHQFATQRERLEETYEGIEAEAENIYKQVIESNQH